MSIIVWVLTVSEVLEEWSVTDHSLNWGNSLFTSSAAAGLLGQLAHTHSVTLKRTILHNKTASSACLSFRKSGGFDQLPFSE